jgi:hypothetical protein
MSIRLSAEGAIELHGLCPIEDAETLQQHLLADPGAIVDWRTCEQAHAAVIQVLMAANANLRGPPGSDFLRVRLEPLLKSSTA